MAYLAPPVTYPEGEPPFTLGDTVTVAVDLTNPNAVPADTTTLTWVVRDPAGVEHDESSNVTIIAGVLQLAMVADTAGTWYWKLTANGSTAVEVVEGEFEVQENYAIIGTPSTPLDLHVLVPRARRYVEGPYGAPEGKPPLSDGQLYEMCADGLGDIVLAAGSQWWNELVVTARDASQGYPTAWATKEVLSEWEAALITSQVALNYFFHLFRDYKTSVTVMNEGSSYAYTLSANVLRDYIASLQQARDNGLMGLIKHHPVMDRYASNIRVRDQATVAMLEWWSRDNSAESPGGLPGGQESYTIPFINGDPWGGYGG